MRSAFGFLAMICALAPRTAAAQRPAVTAADSSAIVAAAARFHSSLAAGDSAAVLALLADDVQVLESGGVESRAQYRQVHLPADIAYAKAVSSVRTVSSVSVVGNAAWIVATSVTTGQNGRGSSQGAELMVFARTAQGWRIAAIHWSSRVRASAPAPDQDRDAVQGIIADLATSIRSGNLTAIDSLFRGRGVHILTDTATTHGWPEYRDNYLKPELARYTNLQFQHSAVEAQIRGNVAWVAFHQELAGMTSSGPAKVSGRGTAVLEKFDGRWQIVHLHVSR